jgi:hypothetical protein
MIKTTITVFLILTILYSTTVGIGYLATPFMEWTFQFPKPIGLFIFLSPIFLLVSIFLGINLKD